ncbi:transcriptional repressor [Kineosporia sp. J2-2]|uniref:Transcriptional repressor n=1 Tax=Kineosporia corallincola TaxID=2835133 RepID=A0ABS5TT58_9ACTN|nr:Fur family transcriptional regulator [Kineosporia corallincola]MBT0774004.1 transcriptional repressor [Kineosporia corallincola]
MLPGEKIRPGRRHRKSRQGDLVRKALSESSEFLSAQNLFLGLRRDGSEVSLSTVYRHLQMFVDRNQVDVIHDAGGEALYRYCGTAHNTRPHHHLVCRVCCRAEEVDSSTPGQWVQAIAAEHDFLDIAWSLDIFGTCPECRAG